MSLDLYCPNRSEVGFTVPSKCADFDLNGLNLNLNLEWVRVCSIRGLRRGEEEKVGMIGSNWTLFICFKTGQERKWTLYTNYSNCVTSKSRCIGRFCPLPPFSCSLWSTVLRYDKWCDGMVRCNLLYPKKKITPLDRSANVSDIISIYN